MINKIPTSPKKLNVTTIDYRWYTIVTLAWYHYIMLIFQDAGIKEQISKQRDEIRASRNLDSLNHIH